MNKTKKFIEDCCLEGKHVRLEPLRADHEAGLISASLDGKLAQLWFCSVPPPDQIGSYIATALQSKQSDGEMPFAIRTMKEGVAGDIIGCTRFCRVDHKNRRLEIGYTWYAKKAQRTFANTECKSLMLAHAFETLQCIAVEFRTHWMNHKSRAAILRLGAKQDGVLRNHSIVAGTKRDTVVFSIIDSEWPTVKQHLDYKLNGERELA